MAKGACIGLAMIIPGVSGGTLVVILGVYDKIIESVSGLFKHFKDSFLFLLPIALGAVAAFAALYFPLTYALKYAPFPTVMLFAGFMLGSCPQLIQSARKNGFFVADAIAAVISLAVVISLCFIPISGNVDLGENMQTGGYFVLVLMGVLASCALVVPGISGSMLMMIFGYYEPLLSTLKLLTSSFGHSLLVLGLFAAGLIIGFFIIARLMQFLLKKFPRTTYWAIVGFVIGSVPAIVITFFREHSGELSSVCGTPHIIAAVVLFILGAVATFFFARYAAKKSEKKE